MTAASPIEVGNFVKVDTDWHQVMYKYANGKLVSGLGLGKGDSYPLLVDSIDQLDTGESAVSLFQGNDILTWYDRKGNAYITLPAVSDDSDAAHSPRLCSVVQLASGRIVLSRIVDFGFFHQVDEFTLLSRIPRTGDISPIIQGLWETVRSPMYWKDGVFEGERGRLHTVNSIIEQGGDLFNTRSQHDLNLGASIRIEPGVSLLPQAQ